MNQIFHPMSQIISEQKMKAILSDAFSVSLIVSALLLLPGLPTLPSC